MKKKLFLFPSVFIAFSALAQIAPHKDFSEKISLAEQRYAIAKMKAPKTYNGNNYDLTYQRMNWYIDPDTLFISGEVTSYFKTANASVNRISFDFSSAMFVDSVVYHGGDISYYHNFNDGLIIYLPSSLPLNQADSVSVYYHGSPPQGGGFGSFHKNVHNDTAAIWTLSEPYGAKDWWPCKNNLSDKIDSVDIYISNPLQYRSSSNGMLISETNGGGIKTAHWKHRYPIATYLVCLAVTNYKSFTIYAHNGNDSIPVLIYSYPEELANAQYYAPDVLNSIELFDSLFITYPFAKERYGMTRCSFSGGMEHQTMTFLNDFAFELMTHELAHQWVGDMITLCDWHEIWLNEGFATYWTGLSYNFFSPGHYWPIWKGMQIANVTSQPDGTVYCSDTTDVNRIFDSRLSYSKGAMVLHMLRWTIGDSAFFAGFRNYLTDTNLAYKYACSDDFITHMENASGKNLTEYFNDWLYGEGYPVYSIHCVYFPVTNDIQVTIIQTTTHPSVSFFKMPVPLRFKDATHDIIIVFDNTFSGQQYIVNAGFKPDSVFLDPDQWIVTKNDTITLSIGEIISPYKISVYPNPVTDDVYIEYSDHHFGGAKLYDIAGKLIFTVNPDAALSGIVDIKMTQLLKGMYFLKATFDEKSIVKKIAKM